MDSLPQAASSSVTVEYSDPSGLFSSVQPVIADKLPLRNLHWKSPTRPVRSIESLRIGFTPAKHEADERKQSSDTPGGALTHRRHQIPGLRQTPYLKIYILRCDDNDTYKSTARKALREWIKSHGSSSTSSTSATSQEKHDAFEWLILHVIQDGEGPEKVAPTSKWGRTTTTVLEKVKADFNGSSKSAVDRVAQIRLPKQGSSQKPPELVDQIEDFVEKVKNGILASFDLRVAQYEEDIKEKDSHRSLPGWNFCTFFILKEGLARGFENVGLFEDALLGYDELAVGLDAAIHEQLQGSSEQHGSAFLTYTQDWKEKAMAALDARVESGKPTEDDQVAPIPDIDPVDFPIDPSKKSYREMILSSNISIFDFRTYIFSRQLALLLRASRAPSLHGDDADASQKSGNKDKKSEDLLLLSEICERATEFISLAARTLRSDLEIGLVGVENAAKPEIISNLVSSWAYAAASQILLQTYTPALTLPESSLHAADAASSQQKPDLPKRTSSLIMPTNRQSRAVKPEIISADGLSSVHTQFGYEGPKLIAKTGSEQLASERGELLLMIRRLLEEVAGRCGWKETWTDLGLLFDDRGPNSGNLDEVSLDDGDSQSAEEPQPSNSLRGVDLPSLKAGLSSRKAFRAYYEELTDRMYRHHIAANRTNSTHTALADMALLRFRQSDYGAAASYFHQIAPFYGNKCWTVLEGVMLEMYSRCLKELNRNEEYVRVMVRLLAKYAAYTQSQLSSRQKTLDASSIFAEEDLVSGYVEELFWASGTLQKDISAPLTDFFADLHVKPLILHYKDRDGFQLQLYLRFLLGKRVDIDSVKIRLVSANSDAQNSEHWIEAPAKTTIKSSSTRILVDSSTTLQGKYFVDRLEMRAGNLLFTMSGWNHLALPAGFREAVDEEGDTRPYIYCYPHPQGLQAKIESPHLVNLEAMRTLELELNSGWNDIKTGILRVRPATAGLRLRIAEVEVVEGNIELRANTESGSIEFQRLGRNSIVRLRMPYTVEEHPAILFARAEVTYETELGRFSSSSTHNIVSALPISVNVQDVFKHSTLFSRFTVGPATMIPLWISKCNIPSSDIYRVQSNAGETTAMRVFPKQPASLLYKIQPREDCAGSPGSRRSLRLSVDFTCVDDECIDTVEKTFKASISDSEFAHYTTLLTPQIVAAYRDQLSTTDMEVIGLVREVEALPYAAVRWDGLLSVLKEPMDGLRAWLKEWHDNHTILSLPEQPSIRQRHIVIPVDIPEIQVVHTAELRLTSLPEQAPHAAVGQTLTAELRLSHTRRWCSPDHHENAGGPLEFSYELHANPDSWMVGGRRRGNFTASEGETTIFAVILLPQKAGHLLLPGLEMRSFVPPAAQSPSTSTGVPAAVAAPAGGPPPQALQRRPIPCEVDYRNHGETVLVLPDLRGTTVSLSMSGGHGGAWLIDSERRVQA